MKSIKFQKLVKKRTELVKQLKVNKADIESILVGLYNDPSHFIYEILQNAEDVNAKSVSFELFENRLDIYHNGRRDFNFKDVEGITGIGLSTKKDDINAIGKFGVGFKSVFAITKSPTIYSGKYHFKIRNLIIPSEIENKGKTKGTKITLPFNHNIRTKEEVFSLVRNKLERLDLKSFLFLKNINEVRWKTPETSGNYFKTSDYIKSYKNVRKVSIIGSTEDHEDFEEHLIIERPFNIDNKLYKVEVGYKIGRDENDKEIIISVPNSKLVVFFPTEKNTFLNFLIQGPFKTTHNRADIDMEDEQNKTIINECGNLVVDSISIIKQLGYLNINFLNILPIDSSYIDSEPIYSVIYKNVKDKLLSDEKLLPTNKIRLTNAKDALLARGKELTEFLNKKDINYLFSKKNWLDTNITYDKTRELRNYLINELEIKEVDFEDFARKVDSKFFRTKSDKWMRNFYGRLLKFNSLWKEKRSILRNKPFIRLENNSHIAPYDEDNNIQVYLPIKTKSKYNTAKKFLQKTGNHCSF